MGLHGVHVVDGSRVGCCRRHKNHIIDDQGLYAMDARRVQTGVQIGGRSASMQVGTADIAVHRGSHPTKSGSVVVGRQLFVPVHTRDHRLPVVSKVRRMIGGLRVRLVVGLVVGLAVRLVLRCRLIVGAACCHQQEQSDAADCHAFGQVFHENPSSTFA